MSQGDDIDLKSLSLLDRARLAALIELEQDADSDLRTHLLGAVGRAETGRRTREGSREVPTVWTQVHVLDRLEEAFAVLATLPAKTRPKQFGNAMQTPVQQKMTNFEWIEAYRSGELEKIVDERNRVRLAPTTAQITRMEEALWWPFEHLADEPELARALSLRALWAAMRVDIRKRCERQGLDHASFNIRWQAGLSAVTARLIARKVPVT